MEAPGLLYPSAGNGAYDETMRPAGADVGELIAHHWAVRWSLPAGRSRVVEVLPGPAVQLVVENGATRVHGVLRRKFRHELSGTGDMFGVAFRPAGFAAVSGRPVSELTDQVVPAPAVLGAGAAAYGHDIAVAGDLVERIRIAERFVLARVPAPPADAAFVNGIVAAIESDRDILRVEDVCERFGIGKRRLQELFRELVGVPPKWVIQRYRLHEAAHRLDSGAARLAVVAAELGYADQAHFSRDFKRIVGVSPAGYARASAGGTR